jgi:hypothetical protein
MSPETDYPKIIIEPEWEWYYFIPYLDRSEWDGVEYEEVKYGWDELDYRFGVEYNPTVPEPSSIGFIIGATMLAVALIGKSKCRD